MRRVIAALVLLATGWVSGAAPGAEKEKPEPAAAKPADSPAAEPKLSTEMAALRDRVRRTLALYFHQPVNTADNTPADVLAFCLAYGCDTEIRYGNAAGQAASGVGCLCWNYPCAGYQLLASDGQRPVVRVGYGLQQYPSQLLGVLAQSSVPAKYEVRVGEFKGTVADLVAAEQLDCRPGGDLSHKLMGMAFYVGDGQTWKNRLGETWSVERLLKEELGRPFATHGADATNRLMGISFAVQRRKRLDTPLEGEFARAEKYLAQYHDYALGLQNPDGTWHPTFFAAKGASNDAWGTLRSTGHIVEWLAFSLPEARLEEPQVVKSVVWLTASLEGYSSRWNAAASTPRDVDSVGHALHALRVYDRRVFKPREG